MDSLKTLIAKKQYALVLDLTKKSHDIDSISFRISALLGLGQLKEALALIKKYKTQFKDGLFNIMKVHFEVLLTLRKYDEAYEEGFEDMMRRVPDISKINRLIGYEPKISLDEILKSVIDYQQPKLQERQGSLSAL